MTAYYQKKPRFLDTLISGICSVAGIDVVRLLERRLSLFNNRISRCFEFNRNIGGPGADRSMLLKQGVKQRLSH